MPVSTLAKGPSEGQINKDLSATVGWDRVVRQLAAVVASLLPTERAKAVILAGDYGAARAVDHLYGAHYGLPHAISGHNSYGWWGPARAADGATTIAVNLSHEYLSTIFGQVAPADFVDTGHGVRTEERGAPIWICRREKTTWSRI